MLVESFGISGKKSYRGTAKWVGASALAISMLGMTPANSQAAIAYNVVDLGLLPSNIASAALGLTSSGTAVGYSIASDASQRAVLYQSGNVTEIGSLGGAANTAYGINNLGRIVGQTAVGSNQHPFYVDSFGAGSVQDLGTFGGANGQTNAVSLTGQMVGAAQDGSGRSFAFTTTGGSLVHLDPTDINGNATGTGLGDTTGGASSSALGVNSAGIIVGQASDATGATRAFVYSGGTMAALPTLGGSGGFDAANAINSTNQIVGSAIDANNSEVAYLYSLTSVDGSGAHGTMTPIGLLAGGSTSNALSINDAGVVVGTGDTDSSSADAFIYQSGLLTDLNSLIDPNNGWQLASATGINSAGQIVGFGIIDGAQHAFLLNPTAIPEPGTLGLITLAATPLLLRRRRR